MNMENKIQIEADTFKMIATLANDRLYFKLWDLIDFIVYERQYTEKDIGGEINRKADLYNLYESVADFKDDDHEQEERKNKMKTYKFGTVYKNKETPCFLIK